MFVTENYKQKMSKNYLFFQKPYGNYASYFAKNK